MLDHGLDFLGPTAHLVTGLYYSPRPGCTKRVSPEGLKTPHGLYEDPLPHLPHEAQLFRTRTPSGWQPDYLWQPVPGAAPPLLTAL